jgi:hypothetical protein
LKVWRACAADLGAWCSNLTAPYLIIVIHGPLLTFKAISNAVAQYVTADLDVFPQHYWGAIIGNSELTMV